MFISILIFIRIFVTIFPWSGEPDVPIIQCSVGLNVAIVVTIISNRQRTSRASKNIFLSLIFVWIIYMSIFIDRQVFIKNILKKLFICLWPPCLTYHCTGLISPAKYSFPEKQKWQSPLHSFTSCVNFLKASLVYKKFYWNCFIQQF